MRNLAPDFKNENCRFWLISKNVVGILTLTGIGVVDEAGYLICGILVSLMAAALPAIRAGRLKPLEAIHKN